MLRAAALAETPKRGRGRPRGKKVHLAVVHDPPVQAATEPATEFQGQPRRRGENYAVADYYRRIDCAYDSACVMHAMRNRWRGFDCVGCTKYTPGKDVEIAGSDIVRSRISQQRGER